LKTLFLVLLVEIFKYLNSNNSWDFCYENNVIYSYSDFIKKDYYNARVLFFSIILCFLFYYILLFNIFVCLFFIILPVRLKRRGMLYNIFVYYPNLLSILFWRYIWSKKNNISFLRALFLNYISFSIWGFPRFVMNCVYISSKILVSYEKNPERFSLREIPTFLRYIYESTYGKTISSIELILN
jgi:hypothetical protein